MSDILFIIFSIAFFAIAILYTFGCEWLIKDPKTATKGDFVETTKEQVERRAV